MNEYHIDSLITSLRHEIDTVKKRMDDKIMNFGVYNPQRHLDIGNLSGLQFALNAIEAVHYETIQTKYETESA